jgi:hypothetical protein
MSPLRAGIHPDQMPAVTPFDTPRPLDRHHSLHCFACGGAIGTVTCCCTTYSLSRDALANALAWAFRDGATVVQAGRKQ